MSLSLLPLIATGKAADGDCAVADFRALALTVHNPTERLAAATQWLQLHGDACSLKDMALIKSSSPAWLGTADSPAIQQVMDRYYNAKAKTAKEDPLAAAAAAQPSPPPAASTAVTAAAKPRVPAASATAAGGATAVNGADAVNNGIATAVAAAAASKAASSIAKTSAAK